MSSDDVKERVRHALTEQVTPLLAMDGGGAEFVDMQGGVVQVRFTGACASCPNTIYALMMSVEEELRKHVPEVEYLEVVP